MDMPTRHMHQSDIKAGNLPQEWRSRQPIELQREMIERVTVLFQGFIANERRDYGWALMMSLTGIFNATGLPVKMKIILNSCLFLGMFKDPYYPLIKANNWLQGKFYWVCNTPVMLQTSIV